MQVDHVWLNARIATCAENMPGIGIIDDGVLACRDGRILFVGSAHDAPKDFDGAEVTDCENRWLTPGLVDCHTHLVYAGDRALEFELRLAGASYEAISRAGGGIVSTVNATRTTSSAQLLEQALRRIDAMIAEGVTTVEIKSGYGLDLINEVKQLRIAESIGNLRAMEVCPTFLGAHALPPEAISADAYIDSVCDVMIPAIAAAKLATAVDAFYEGIGFTAGQVARVFDAAGRHGLRVKLHADQLSNLEGAALASRYNALSADHLEYTSATGVQAMAAAGVVSVLLPGAYYFMRETQLPPIAALREARVAMAIATDCNPGTSPLTSILTAMNMAATLFRMTTDECLLGVTRHAAAALGRSGDIGSLEVGKLANLAIWQINRPAELTYHIGYNPLHGRVFMGKSDGK